MFGKESLIDGRKVTCFGNICLPNMLKHSLAQLRIQTTLESLSDVRGQSGGGGPPFVTHFKLQTEFPSTTWISERNFRSCIWGNRIINTILAVLAPMGDRPRALETWQQRSPFWDLCGVVGKGYSWLWESQKEPLFSTFVPLSSDGFNLSSYLQSCDFASQSNAQILPLPPSSFRSQCHK